MAEMSGSAPLRGPAHPAARPAGQTTQEGATARTARLFNRELGELNRLQRTAQQKGEVVTEAAIALEFEPQGPKLVAIDASTSFTAMEPAPRPVDAVVTESKPAEAKPPADETSPAMVAVREQVADRVTKLNQTLGRATPPVETPQPADSSLDETA